LNRLEESVSAWPVNGMPATLAGRTRRVYDRLAAVYPVSTMLFHSRAHRCALGASGLRDGMEGPWKWPPGGEMFCRLIRANRGRLPGRGPSRTWPCARAPRAIPDARSHCQGGMRAAVR
jgi:hypothetical protein